MKIKIKRFKGSLPIAYTDFVDIFISESITDSNELELLYLHEAGHIWLQHLERSKILLKKEGDKFDLLRWAQATDLEIALHLYSDIEESIIHRPRSLLNSAISKKDTLAYPNCIYAEEFYEELLNTPLENDSHDGEANEMAIKLEDLEKIIGEQDVKELIKTAIKNYEEAKEEFNKQNNKQEFETKSKKFMPKASLASEIDCILGRSALLRIDSYARPSRRENSDFIKKGRINKQKTAKLVIYVDRSGSFTPEKTAKANENLDRILKKYRAKINKDIVYFSDDIFFEEPKYSGGTNYLAVAKDIAKNNAELSIIITDDDYCDNQCEEVLKNCKTKILVIPIDCSSTNAAPIFKAKEFRE